MRSPPPVPVSGLTFLTRKEAARELRVSLARLDRIIGRGQLKTMKRGHATIVMPDEINRYLENLPDVTPRSPAEAT
jgi:hypothetical protein